MTALLTLYFCRACRAAVEPAGRDYPGADAAHPCDGCGTVVPSVRIGGQRG